MTQVSAVQTGQCHVLPDFEANRVVLTALRGSVSLKGFRDTFSKLAKKYDENVKIPEAKGVRLVVEFTDSSCTRAFVSSLGQVGKPQSLDRK